MIVLQKIDFAWWKATAQNQHFQEYAQNEIFLARICATISIIERNSKI